MAAGGRLVMIRARHPTSFLQNQPAEGHFERRWGLYSAEYFSNDGLDAISFSKLMRSASRPAVRDEMILMFNRKCLSNEKDVYRKD